MILKKFKIFWNNPSIFSKRDPKFEHFEKSVAFCGVFATFIVFWLNSRFFPGRTHLLLEKQQTLNVLLNRTISVAFYGKLATLSNLKKFTITLGNPIYFFFLKKNQVLNILRKFTISVAFYGKLATLSNLKKFTIFFFKKLIFLPWKNPISERFEKSYYFMSIKRQLCYLKWFWKKKIQDFVLKKKRICFCLKKPKIWAFSEITRVLRHICYL